jgi:hypothetical protein
MFSSRLPMRLLILAPLICLALSPFSAAQAHRRAKKAEAIPAAVATPPPAPLTPAQMPAVAPVVDFKAGQLTITAPNSTLGDILREVKKQTGASIDVPGNATERVMGIFGPGPARDVLSTLLDGSHFNYVLLGSATDPNALDRVMLLSKPVGEPMNPPANQAQMQRPPIPAPPGGQAAESMEFGNNNEDNAADNQPDSNDIFGTAADDQGNQGQQADDQQGQNNPFGNPNNQVKTPQQLLQELQQQQQQGQNPNNPNPGMRPGMPGFPGFPPQPNNPQQ